MSTDTVPPVGERIEWIWECGHDPELGQHCEQCDERWKLVAAESRREGEESDAARLRRAGWIVERPPAEPEGGDEH